MTDFIERYANSGEMYYEQYMCSKGPIKLDGFSLDECIASLVAVRDAIPEDARSSAYIELFGEYGVPPSDLRISYIVPKAVAQ